MGIWRNRFNSGVDHGGGIPAATPAELAKPYTLEQDGGKLKIMLHDRGDIAGVYAGLLLAGKSPGEIGLHGMRSSLQDINSVAMLNTLLDSKTIVVSNTSAEEFDAVYAAQHRLFKGELNRPAELNRFLTPLNLEVAPQLRYSSSARKVLVTFPVPQSEADPDLIEPNAESFMGLLKEHGIKTASMPKQDPRDGSKLVRYVDIKTNTGENLLEKLTQMLANPMQRVAGVSPESGRY